MATAVVSLREGDQFVGVRGENVVRRVIGVGGDRVACCAGTAGERILLNGTPLVEPYVRDGVGDGLGQPYDVRVPDGRLLLLAGVRRRPRRYGSGRGRHRAGDRRPRRTGAAGPASAAGARAGGGRGAGGGVGAVCAAAAVGAHAVVAAASVRPGSDQGPCRSS
ncbi:S26 family signal peptidase [Streptomyces sp. NPDC052687]|uniref:S26 family signal peptidase n=1 Tax=Streptomyces sp. NPDC052687 TaxID=3154759 RepID=UPI0034442F69